MAAGYFWDWWEINKRWEMEMKNKEEIELESIYLCGYVAACINNKRMDLAFAKCKEVLQKAYDRKSHN